MNGTFEIVNDQVRTMIPLARVVRVSFHASDDLTRKAKTYIELDGASNTVVNGESARAVYDALTATMDRAVDVNSPSESS